jgi:molybdenum cofactor biosynthesis enzyme MoaA
MDSLEECASRTRGYQRVMNTTLLSSESSKIGCLMCDSLYIKANGELPCWDDVGEALILRTIDEQALLLQQEAPLFDFPRLVEIRRAFLAGKDPHQQLCSHCAVRGQGLVTSLYPKIMRILHIEPSYLCQLSCPQCLPPKSRQQLKKPPYNMSLSFYQAILQQLCQEDISNIRLVHFEGRGEPLLNKDLDQMIRCTKKYYPNTFTKVTSHGNFPFQPWMFESGLDLLRLSVDGAFENSYLKYRVGGDLAKVLELMRAIRDHKHHYNNRLRVEWKYILFEWNDSDEEISTAARLADELEVDLHFCLTHSPGKSTRFHNIEVLRDTLAVLAPYATLSLTFQLKSASDADIGHLIAEHCEALLLSALKHFHAGKISAGRANLIEALAFDPGLQMTELATADNNPLTTYLQHILVGAKYPCTLSALANIALVFNDWKVAKQLFQGYLRLAPQAPDRNKIEQKLLELQTYE